MNLLERVKQIANGAEYVRQWLGDGATTVEPELAQARASVCLECPKMIAGAVLTDAAADSIKRMLELKSKLNLKVSGEKRLGTCSVCSCVMRLKVWWPIERVCKITTEAEQTLYWEKCWIRKESA